VAKSFYRKGGETRVMFCRRTDGELVNKVRFEYTILGTDEEEEGKPIWKLNGGPSLPAMREKNDRKKRSTK